MTANNMLQTVIDNYTDKIVLLEKEIATLTRAMAILDKRSTPDTLIDQMQASIDTLNEQYLAMEEFVADLTDLSNRETSSIASIVNLLISTEN